MLDGDEQARLLAAEALGKINPQSKQVADKLTDAFRAARGDRDLRRGIAHVLGKMPLEAGPLPGLLRALADEDSQVSQAAAEALRRHASSFGRDHVADLKAALKSKSTPVRLFASTSLADLGAAAKEAFPDLRLALKDRDRAVRLQAVRAITKFGARGKDAAGELAAMLKDRDRLVRVRAALALVSIDAPPRAEVKAAIPVLVRALRPESAEKLTDEKATSLVEEVTRALVAVGKPAVDPLAKALRVDFRGGNRFTGEAQLNGVGRLVALQVLKQIGPKANSRAMQALLVELMTRDPLPVVREAAKDARLKLQAKE
jgi:HEAT repeat protein